MIKQGLAILMLCVLAVNVAAKPKVVVLATGGTIAGAGESEVKSSYQAAQLPIDAIINSVPEVHELAELSGEQIAQVGSQAMSNDIWLKLAASVNKHLANDDVDGVVITHGTDTMEETAFFLSLTATSDKPVVLVGSMRPATGLSGDGARNLYSAVAVAASPKAKGYGVVIVMNDVILLARSATKSSTTKVEAFAARNGGPLGKVELGNVTFYQPPTKQSLVFDVSKANSLPQVDIVYGYANASPVAVNALVAEGAKGIVVAGVGNGNLYPAVEQALVKAVNSDVIVVRSSRVGEGHVLRNNEIDDDKLGFIVADDLNPQKARVLLMLALTQAEDKARIQQWFYR